MRIQTERLILRDFCVDDIAHYVAMTSEPDYQTYYREDDCDPDFSRQLAQCFIEQSRENPRQKFQLAIEEKHSGAFIGTVGLRMENVTRASFGFGLMCEYQGRGIAFEAASALIAFGFDQLGVDVIYAETLLENTAAIRLCEKLGMVETGRVENSQVFKGRSWTDVEMSIAFK